jgi:hypothetical protein
MAIIQTDDLPAWARDLVLKDYWLGDFTELARALDPGLAHRGVRRLTEDQRHRLYRVAQPAFVKQAWPFYCHFRAGNLEGAHYLRSLINSLTGLGKLDLKADLGLSQDDWDRLVYLDQVYGVKKAYRLALDEFASSKHQLAENLLACRPIEAWEYGADPLEVARLAREGYRAQIDSWIQDCREDGGRPGINLRKAVSCLAYRLDDLGVTLTELDAWARQDYCGKIRIQLGTSLASDEANLLLNSAWSLQCMVEHGITPEEAGLDRAKLAAARDRLAAWLPSATQQPNREVGPMCSRQQLQAYQAVILPLFDVVLAL